MEKEIINLTRYEIKKSVFNRFPTTPGIYIYWGKKTLRVGDPMGRWPIYVGKSVNLKSRLSSYLNINLSPKTHQMVKEADSVSYIRVTTELESLLLEAKLIKNYMPRYNIIAKDDKHPLYIAITKEEFPRVLAVRSLTANDYRLVTSYGPFPNSSNVKTILRMIRKVFPYSDHKLGKKPCLYSHLGLCEPCPNEVARVKNYESRIMKIKQYKQNIRNIKRLLEGKFTVLQKDLIRQMSEYSKKHEFEEAGKIRNQLRSLEYILQPKIDPQEFIQNPNLESDLRAIELKNLERLLSTYYMLHTTIRRIECYDIAHLGGSAGAASMVVFIDGRPDNSEYRHYKVKQSKGNSDYDSLFEIAQRRLKNMHSGKKAWPRPDLIVVDGGLGQVRTFNKVFIQEKIPVVGIAKHPDRIVFPDGTKIPAPKLIQRMRDEAHRFARRYHHLLLKKNLLS